MDEENRKAPKPFVRPDKSNQKTDKNICDTNKVRVVDNAEECEVVVKELRLHCQEYSVLGFNCTRTNSRIQKTSILLLSSHQGLCAKIRLSDLKTIPKSLEELLTDENILKASPDARFVAKKVFQYNVHTASVFDLRYLERPSNFSRLCETYLNMKIEGNPASNRTAERESVAAIELFKTFQEKSQSDVRTFVQEHCTSFLNQVYRKRWNVVIERPNTGTALNNQTIRLIENVDDCRAIAELLRKDCDSYAVVGFSCRYTNRVATLLQLVTSRGLCALIVLSKVQNIPDELQDILSDQKILKIGVDVFRHVGRMKRDYGVHVASALDLRYLAKECQHKPYDLGRLSIVHLNIDIQANDWRLQNIDWKSETFSEEEIKYAADDVHVRIELFKLFEGKLVEEKYSGDRTKFIEEICVPNLGEDFPKRTEKISCNQSLPEQEIRVVTTVEECQAVVKQLRMHCDEYNVLGFDCEIARNSTRIPILQLASHRGLCALFRLCKIEKIPTELKDLLQDKNILKVGITPETVANKLKLKFDFDVTSTFDLTKLAKKCKYRATGLKSLSEEVLNVELKHKKHGLITNRLHRKWEKETLDEVNIKYAADDAHASIELFRKFQQQLMGGNDDEHTNDAKRFIEEHCEPLLQK